MAPHSPCTCADAPTPSAVGGTCISSRSRCILVASRSLRHAPSRRLSGFERRAPRAYLFHVTLSSLGVPRSTEAKQSPGRRTSRLSRTRTYIASFSDIISRPTGAVAPFAARTKRRSMDCCRTLLHRIHWDGAHRPRALPMWGQRSGSRSSANCRTNGGLQAGCPPCMIFNARIVFQVQIPASGLNVDKRKGIRLPGRMLRRDHRRPTPQNSGPIANASRCV
ncbi:hypothetical protein BD413DRAFT_188096 [Trametes elegans]|nr:hypothetical protein BD413DRAFT_188096 [Trametes elegans]